MFDTADRLLRCERVSPAGPRLYVTHGGLQWVDQRAADLQRSNVVEPFGRSRVILLVRHPIEALVSLYHYHEADRRFASADALLADPVWGLEKAVAFLNIWATEAKDRSDVLLCRYADLREDPTGGLLRLVEFAGMPAEDSILAQAVDRASFDEMRRLQERREDPAYRSTGVRILSAFEEIGVGPKVRSGEVGAWRDELEPQTVAELEQLVRDVLDPWYGFSN